MNKKRFLSLVGPGILCFGVFAPALRVPALGNLNYFFCGQGDGALLLTLALISLLLAVKSKYSALWYTGLACSGVVAYTYLNFHRRLSELNPLMAQNYQLSWGWAVLIVGIGTVIVSAALKEKIPQPSSLQ